MSGWWRRLSHDRRVFLLGVLVGLPGVAVALGFVWLGEFSARLQWTVTVLLLGSGRVADLDAE